MQQSVSAGESLPQVVLYLLWRRAVATKSLRHDLSHEQGLSESLPLFTVYSKQSFSGKWLALVVTGPTLRTQGIVCVCMYT